MTFSQRIGKRPIKTILQVEAIDDELKTRIWNVVLDYFFRKLNSNDAEYLGKQAENVRISKVIWKEFFIKRIDKFPYTTDSSINGFISYTSDWFFKANWFEIYDFIEFLSAMDSILKFGFADKCNLALEKEVSGYRIIETKVIQITSEQEIQEIEEAILNSDKWRSVNTHLKTSLDSLADRKTPDYRNSIKESISAVEAFCKIITADDSATLGKALIEIEKKHKLHGALKTAFSAIYGYTSDSSGIRHSLLESDVKVEFEDAKLMLVMCSTFINYLKTKAKL